MASSLWEFVRRNRNKIAAGATLLGGVYTLKKVWESDVFAETVVSLRQVYAGGDQLSPPPPHSISHVTLGHEEDPGKLVEVSRRRFVFSSHRQSCEKLLLSRVLPALRDKILERFNVEQLVEMLKTGNFSSNSEKVAIWESLKIHSVARLVAVAFAYPLFIIAFSVQKSILCAELCAQAVRLGEEVNVNNADSAGSWKHSIASLISRVTNLGVGDEEVASDKSASDSTNTARGQLLFNNCIRYLVTEGLEQLFALVEETTTELISPVPLAGKALTQQDIRKLVEQAMTAVEMKLKANDSGRLVDLVVPIDRPVVASLSASSVHLQQLLSRLTRALRSRQCCAAMSSMQKLYREKCFEITDSGDEQQSGAGLPLAKYIPLLADTFSGLTVDKGVATATMRSLMLPELDQLCWTLVDPQLNNEQLLPLGELEEDMMLE